MDVLPPDRYLIITFSFISYLTSKQVESTLLERPISYLISKQGRLNPFLEPSCLLIVLKRGKVIAFL